jgi:hypothetical protein
MSTQLPSDLDVTNNKIDFAESIAAVLGCQRKTAKVTVRDKLRLLNDELVKFKHSGISYQIICELLKDKVGIQVSTQTLREHCQQELGFDKRKSGVVSAKETAKTVRLPLKKVNGKATERVSELAPAAVTSTSDTPTTRIPIRHSANEQIAQQTQNLINQLEDY